MEDQPKTTMARPALIALAIVAAAVAGWEGWLRAAGHRPAHDDGGPLWAHHRAMACGPADRTTVFVGSSRIKFDLDLATWQREAGTRPVQLAFEGENPRPALEDLAADPNFRGRLVVDVVEDLFFSNAPHSTRRTREAIEHFRERSPAQRASFAIGRWLERGLVFLDKDDFSLNARLDALRIPSREGVFMMPTFPTGFNRVNAGRQCLMTDGFLADTAAQREVRDIWLFFESFPAPPMGAGELDSIFISVKAATDRIRSRGGEVFFVKCPATGHYREYEAEHFPREKYWGRLLQETGCKGMHYADSPELLALDCPEWSHLTPAGAAVFTKKLAEAVNGR